MSEESKTPASLKKIKPPNGGNQIKHYIDGAALSNDAVNRAQNDADGALALIVDKGCLGITKEDDPNHMWASYSKAVSALYLTRSGTKITGATVRTWVHAIPTTNGGKDKAEGDKIAADKRFEHCKGTSVDGTLQDKAETIKRYMVEILVPAFGGGLLVGMDPSKIQVMPPILSQIDAKIDPGKNPLDPKDDGIILTVTATSEKWRFGKKTDIVAGKIEGTNDHKHK